MLLIWIVFWIACALATMAVAGGKARSAIGWLILGFVFGPIALLIAAAMSPNREAMEARETRAGLRSGKLKKCARCAEPILREATVCRYCGSAVMPLPPL